MCLLGMLASGTASAAEDCGVVRDVIQHLPDGTQTTGDLSWKDGRFESAAEGCASHQFPQGAQVTPGFVALPTHLGLVEIELESGTRTDRLGNEELRGGVLAVDGYNPRTSVVPVTRLGGVTSALVSPSGGFVTGVSGWVTLETGRRSDAVVEPRAALEVSLDNPALGLAKLRTLLREASYFSRLSGSARVTAIADLSANAENLRAFAAVQRRELPLLVYADRADVLEGLAAFAKSSRIDMVVVGAAEGWLVADLLADAGVGVVIDPLVYGAGGFDQLRGREDNAVLLTEAGVQVAITTRETHNARSLRYSAANAVRGGLAHADALAAITRVPSDLLGQSDRGRIENGAHADFAVWSGDPLEPSSRLLMLVIEGVSQPLKSRQSALVEAWRELPRRLDAED
jgi:hypothetical protein